MSWAHLKSGVQITIGSWLLVARVISCLGASGNPGEAPSPAAKSAEYCAGRLDLAGEQFNLSDSADLRRLQRSLERELNKADSEGDSDRQPGSAKRRRRGLREGIDLARALSESGEDAQSPKLRAWLLETMAALSNLQRPPVPQKIDFFETPLAFLERCSRPVGKGRTPAANLDETEQNEPSRVNPRPSSFWNPPRSITQADLYHGFGHTNLLLAAEPICEYLAPKESFGRNPGFEVQWEGTRLKLKFAEISSEPFATRIFDALGFHTDPTDYAARVRVRYTRRIFEEFNQRKPLQTHFTFMGFLPLFTLRLQQHYDPFEYVNAAVLKDGTRWSGQELKSRLLREPRFILPELHPGNFRPEIESRIDYIETKPASVQLRRGKSIGPWDFGDLDHASRRELRGAGLLAGWLGWFDTRFDNTRLRIVQGSGGRQLEHYFSDLGGVLGETKGLLYARGELPNSFPWSFTRPGLWQGPHRLARPLRLVGYKPVVKTPAFAEMTIDDARWMARLIGQLRPEQIEQALVASGFDSAQVRLYLAKLLSRRNRMMTDLGLANEVAPLSGYGANGHFDYRPTVDGPVRVRVENELVTAPLGTNCVANGKLLPDRESPRGASESHRRTAIQLSF